MTRSSDLRCRFVPPESFFSTLLAKPSRAKSTCLGKSAGCCVRGRTIGIAAQVAVKPGQRSSPFPCRYPADGRGTACGDALICNSIICFSAPPLTRIWRESSGLQSTAPPGVKGTRICQAYPIALPLQLLPCRSRSDIVASLFCDLRGDRSPRPVPPTG